MCASALRQTLVAVAGVATGVGFSIMMAALMEGSQDDFTRQLIDALPHITVTDERRKPPLQPAETLFDAAEIHGLTPEARRRGIKNPMAIMASLEAWVPGAIAPSVKVQAIIRYASRDVGDQRDRHRSASRAQGVGAGHADARRARSTSLYRATNAIILGDRLAEKIGARIGANITVQTSEGARINAQVVGLFHSGVRQIDESTAYVLIKTGADPRPADRPGERVARARRRSDGAARGRRSASSARPATSRCPGRRRTRTCSRPS